MRKSVAAAISIEPVPVRTRAAFPPSSTLPRPSRVAAASVAALREDPVGGGGPALRSLRFDAYYGLARPIPVREWLAITPVAGGRVTHYTDTQGAAGGTYTRTLGNIKEGVSLEEIGAAVGVSVYAGWLMRKQ